MDAKCERKITKQIIIEGLVQGIGFRPYVYNLAVQYDMRGNVLNAGGIVEIHASGTEQNFTKFLDGLTHPKLRHARIDNMHMVDVPEEAWDAFHIIESEQTGKANRIVIPADLPVCDCCLEELNTEENRRHQHHFISCIACGPRYTIIQKLPYDRENTVMEDFGMCELCQAEYENCAANRYFCQTISCKQCGPQSIYVKGGAEYVGDEAFGQAVCDIAAQSIIAVKGIGGFHFVCSPFCEQTVTALRHFKGREHKPFAIMFQTVAQIKKVCAVSEEEADMLMSPIHPIVLLRFLDEPYLERPFAPNVVNGSLYCGCFLPTTALQYMMVEQGGPLIFTSGNISDSPIIQDEDDMLALCADRIPVLYNKRRIHNVVDDSVVKFCADGPMVIRRARGYVPDALPMEATRNVFAAGGDLKSAFCMLKDGLAYVSSFMGDLENFLNCELYQKSVDYFFNLLSFAPTCIVCDLHPNYFSRKIAEKLSQKLSVPLLAVQHHHAHIASVMAEHGITDPIIGVAFDGTGYGTDGHIWGGEFLICHKQQYTRYAHLNDTKIIGGDASLKDAAKTACCYTHHLHDCSKLKTPEENKMIRAGLQNNINTVFTSSMGRLFDVVSALLGICYQNQYEGHGAMELEKIAELGFERGEQPIAMAFGVVDGQAEAGVTIEYDGLLQTILSCAEQNESIYALALGFHRAVADMITTVCKRVRHKQAIHNVALSGGVFQNKLLLNLAIEALQNEGFAVFRNVRYPSGDGCISLGQAYLAGALC